MRRASTYPTEVPKMTALCGNCGKVWALHGAYDGGCPVEDTAYGMARKSATFWTPKSRNPKGSDKEKT